MKLTSTISTSSSDYQANRERYERAARELREKLAGAATGGGAKAQEYQRSLGKMLARERIAGLIDEGTELLELSPLAGDSLYEDDVPGGGLVTGVGLVSGRSCMIVANDQTVKGGTYYPITVKKHLRAQEIAAQNHL